MLWQLKEWDNFKVDGTWRKMGRLYHYTNQRGYENIKKSGIIRQSQNFEKDCVYGDGVYLTTLNPEDFSKEDLAKNNYGGGWRRRMSDGRLDYYIEIEISYSDLKLERCKTSDDWRDVYLYSGVFFLAWTDI